MKVIKDKDIFTNPEHETPESFEERQTVKIIIKNKEGKIALITNPVHNFFLLPGGGAESDDLIKEAEREAVEETNWYINNITEVSKTEEWRNRGAKHYVTTCFTADTTTENDVDLRTEEEKENGLVTKWFTYEEALKLMEEQVEKQKRGEVEFYNTAFNIVRDYGFIKDMK
jgi:ADP-ribose pyrophosphatase YjhB (NUDIX family)